MASTLRYGENTIDLFPDNTAQQCSPQDVRDVIVSQRSGGALVSDDNAFTVPITDGVPISINPLLPSPQLSPGLWGIDTNSRLFPNYNAIIADLVIPPGYSKLAQVFISLAAQKAGSGEDVYTFQLDNDGTPAGQPMTISLAVAPTVVAFLANLLVDLTGTGRLGVTVTGVGTGDDIDVSSFEMVVIDNQIWRDPA